MKTFAFVLNGLFLAALCHAADPVFDVKPGLWNITNTTQMNGTPPIPNYDKLTPEQKAQFDAVMKNMASKPNTATVKSCVTRDGIAKAIARANSNGNNTCSPKLVSSTASKLVLHVECRQEKGEMRSNGDISIERADAGHVTGSGDIKTTNGVRTMDLKWSMTGVFVSTDCGDVKPFDK